MISDIIENRNKYEVLKSTKFKIAFDWLIKNKADPPSTGVHQLEHGIRAIVETYKPEPLGTRDFENHHQFIDIQFLAAGTEWLFWTTPLKLPVKSAYNEANDIEFFASPNPLENSSCLRLHSDQFIVLFPGDWHMPCIAPYINDENAKSAEAVVKFVFKIPVDSK